MAVADDPNYPGSADFWMREIRGQVEELDLADGKTMNMREAQAVFLAALVRQCGITLACGVAGRTISTYERWRDEDPIFNRCLKMAKQAQSDALVAEAHRRGVEGVTITIRDKAGNVVDTVQKYSDGLLIKLLQGLDSEQRFSKIAAADTSSRDEWRKALATMAENPEAIKLMEELADFLVGEGEKP